MKQCGFTTLLICRILHSIGDLDRYLPPPRIHLRYRCVPFCPKMVAALPKNRQNITFQPPMLPKSGKNGYGSSPTLDLHSSGAQYIVFPYTLSSHWYISSFPTQDPPSIFARLPAPSPSFVVPQSTVLVHISLFHRSPFHSPVHNPLLPLKLRVPPLLTCPEICLQLF